MFASVFKVIEQFFSKKKTNIFPIKHTPRSITELFASGKIHSPIEVPDGFRGELEFSYDTCIGCAMCHKVCPANAIELYPVQAGEKKSKRIVIYLSRCTFCGECVDICPKDAIVMNKNFMMADADRNGAGQVVGLKNRADKEIIEADEATI